MSEKDERPQQSVNKLLGIFIVVLLWGMVLVMLSPDVAKDIVNNQEPQIKSIIGLVVAAIIIVGSLIGDKVRRVVGVIGLIGMVAGLLMMVITGGLGMAGLFGASLLLIVFGLTTGVFLLFSESEST